MTNHSLPRNLTGSSLKILKEVGQAVQRAPCHSSAPPDSHPSMWQGRKEEAPERATVIDVPGRWL